MLHDLHQTLALLTRTPSALDALLRDLSSEWTDQNEGGETWNVPEILGHLIYGEQANWMPRARMILVSGDSLTFEPFDRLGHVTAIQGKSLHYLLDEFADIRSKNVNELRSLNLQQEHLGLRGHHPAFGTVTLAQLLATWSVHDLTHLRQIARVMAHQYREAVGPWSEYLGILKHSN